MAQYLILIYGDEQAFEDGGQPLFDKVMQGHNDFSAANSAAIKGGEALTPVATATSIRQSDDGPATVTDGPFVESKEALGGYYVVEAPDLDAAIEIAKQVPAPFGGVEVRPVMSFD